MSFDEEKQSDIIKALSSTSRYLNDLLNIDNNYFDGLISEIYPLEFQFNKSNYFETEGPFLDLHLSILGCFISCKMYDKRDEIVLFHAKCMINAMIMIFLTWMECISSSILRCLYIATNSIRRSA